MMKFKGRTLAVAFELGILNGTRLFLNHILT